MLFVFWCCGTQLNVGKVAKNNSIANNENVIKIQSGCRFLTSIHCFMIQTLTLLMNATKTQHITWLGQYDSKHE